MSLHCIVWCCMVLLCILWYCIVLHVIVLYRMVLQGIVLLASACGLYLARHLPTLFISSDRRSCSHSGVLYMICLLFFRFSVYKVALKCGNYWNSVGLRTRKYKQYAKLVLSGGEDRFVCIVCVLCCQIAHFSLRIRIVNFATEEIVFWLKELFWRNWFPSCNIRLFLDWRKENIKSHQPSLVFNLKIILEQSRSSRNGDSSGLGKGSIKKRRKVSPSPALRSVPSSPGR